VIASQQPFHGNPSPSQLNVWKANLGTTRAERGWAFADVLDSGARLVFGSDWPVVSLDPRLGLNMAVNRTTPERRPEGGWLPHQRIDVMSAVDAYTSGPAYASFDDQRKGSISKGMLADIVILSGDIFTRPPERLLDAQVDVTIFDGKVVFSRDKAMTSQ
jgi:predicted amidohydrolase YtcJ